MHRVGYPEPDQLDLALRALGALPGTWEIKMTGGEPFSSRAFLERIVPGLMASSHRISVLTNLSAPVKQLQRFAALTRGRLGIVSASLHREFTEVEPFLARLQALRDAVDPGTRIVVNSVLVPDELEAIAVAKRSVEAAGFRFFPQLMKVKHGVVDYSPAQWERVREIVGDLDEATFERTANMAPSYRGRLCWTGVRYFVLLQTGDAWSCRSARRYDVGYLGNVYAGTFALHDAPTRCRFPLCPCTVPANRGMIEGVRAHLDEGTP